ncbi:Lon protease [uncultured delta proteobacterium]|uniref:Lon protease n=1 Tax=uncultured delta proteobacterium TaxID=34034 RepID=A0A212JL36_9DELT|nr:Lon protease [uncultured delta proteobacterium]
MTDDIFRPGDDKEPLAMSPSDNTIATPPVTAEDSEGHTPPDFPNVLPVLPVRDIVLFNYMILPLHVGREASVKAVDAALNGSRYLFVLTQKDEAVDEPGPDDLYTTGTVVMVMRMLKMPDNRLKLLVQGVSRAKADTFVEKDGYLEASISPLAEPDDFPLTVKVEAMMRAAREQCEKILAMRGMASPEIVTVLSGLDHPGRLADLIASNLRLKIEDAQAILECLDPIERLSMVNKHLSKEVEVTNMQAKIQESAREGMDKAQRDYFLREQLKAIRKELGDFDSEDADLDELAEALEKAKLPKDVKKEADKQLKRLATMHGESSEATVTRTYLEWLAELPWSKLSRDRLSIPKAEEILAEDHYGLDKVKERILEFLSVRKLNPKSKGPILCFVGPPGVGKTSLGRSIAKAMGRKFQRMSLGGMRDEAEIRGHRRTYVGALPGRIIQTLRTAGTRNPVIMLDEIDKIGADFRGDPSSALLEVLDPEQNFSFSDHYLNVPFDLSKVMFICTANNLETIPGPLRDRMEIIRIPGYTMQEKLVIARRFLLPRQIRENGLTPKDMTMADAVMQSIIEGYTREAGLRNLEREVGSVCRKLARRKAEGVKGPFAVTPAMVHEFLGAPRFSEEEREKVLTPGVAMGLAWTPFGGEVLSIEVSTMKGKGKLTLTGQLGDVMKESAQAAVSYARANAETLGIDPCFTDNLDIHLHVPAGATPKDGPSAGVTIATALVSALSGKPVNPALCMTGEITLRGRVLPIGGVKEKILAGVARGFTDVIIPKQNMKDLEDIPKDLLEKIAVHPAVLLEDVFGLAFAATIKKAKAKGTPPSRKAASVPKRKAKGVKLEKEKRVG